MQQNKLAIRINKPVSEVFEFTTNPVNTPAWVTSILKEETDTDVIGKGTTYTNESKGGEVGTYVVSAFEPSALFELTDLASPYHVRYTYTSISDQEAELEYYEWVDSGELSNPFDQSTLDKLKSVLESV